MKLLCLIFTTSIISISISAGEIKNGYVDIENAREALKSLVSSAKSNANLTDKQYRKVKSRIKFLTDYILCFELTENLLQQFRIIAPELYHEIDTLKDRNGKSTDVFIRFILKEHTTVQHPGATYILHKEGDDTSYSEYGPQSASVKIWIMDTSLTILAHELGHVKYEVPNLASYDLYHKLNYRSSSHGTNYQGHIPSDPSGKIAFHFEKRFGEMHKNYKRTSAEKLTSPFKLMDKIRKKLKQNKEA